MFNLLPQPEHLAIAREYRLRLAVVSLLFLSSLGLVATIALVPSLFLSYGREETALKTVNSLQGEIKSASAAGLSEPLKAAGKKAAALATSAAGPYSYEIIADVIKHKTPDVSITGVSVKGANDGSREVAVIGEAADRDALLSFTRTLQREKIFTAVTVPVSNFAPAANINFSIIAKTQ